MIEKKLLIDYPILVREWDYEKNVDLDVNTLTHGSQKKVWWKCSTCSNSWNAAISNRAIKKNSCPKCANRKNISINEEFPELINFWDFEKNERSPDHYTSGSKSIVWWKCNEGHSYDSKISTRVKTSGCPYCSNQRILSGYNDFASQRPELLKLWNYSKNNIDPCEISPNSGKMVWWLCDNGHDFENSPNMISKGRTCPYCSNKKVMIGFNDAATVEPKLIPLWSQKNDTTLSDYVFGSAKKAWWRCSKNHEFRASIRDMVKSPNRCAICSNKTTLSGFNDVATIKPELLQYWDYEKNDYKPSEVTIGRSADKTYWKCHKGHSFSSTLSDVNQGKWCFQCSVESYVSKPEKEILSFLEDELNFQVECSSRKIISPYEIDLYIPEKKIAIEFNGLYWHSEKYMKEIKRKNVREYHFNKWKLCQDKGIQLITIWEDDWRDHKEKIKNMIAYKLGCSKKEKIAARKTLIKEIKSKEVIDFLNVNHIQGHTNGLTVGLFSKENGALISVGVFKKRNDTELELLRYASSEIVQGGLGKILNYVEKNNPSVKKIITFADHEVSDGGLYEKLGFETEKVLRPDYKYIYKNKRHHKFLFRKQRFEKDPDLFFDRNMSERELAIANNVHRVWDCGKTKYVKKI